MKHLVFKTDKKNNKTNVFVLDENARGAEIYLGTVNGVVNSESQLKEKGFTPVDNILYESKDIKIVRPSIPPVIR